MRKTSLFKRSLAGLLTLVLVLGMIPVLGGGKIALKAEAAPVDTSGAEIQDYITMPITIRDFAADGMLFEYNETGNSGYAFTSQHAGYNVYYDPTSFAVNTGDDNSPYRGIRVYSGTQPVSQMTGYGDFAAWYCIFVDANGNVVGRIPKGTSKANFETTYNSVKNAIGGTIYSVWAWGDSPNSKYNSILAEIDSWLQEMETLRENNELNDMSLSSKYKLNLQSLTDSYGTTTYTLNIGNSYQSTTGNPSFGDNNFGLRKTTATSLSQDNVTWWHCLVCDSTGHVTEVIPSGEAKMDRYASAMAAAGTNAFSVWAWGGTGEGENDTAYNKISHITNDNCNDYWINFSSELNHSTNIFGDLLFVDKRYDQANTKGFGMLYTNETDIHDGINEWLDVGELKNSYVAWNDFTIAEGGDIIDNAGSIYNGFYYDVYETTIDDTTYSFTHYSPHKYVDLWEVDENGNQTNYANQMLVGGTIRTNLMQKYLKDGKPVYTEDAVNWIAEYMQLAMKTPEQNGDGSYNTAFVTGYAHEALGGETLAAKIRQQVNDDPTTTEDDEAKLGSYDASYNKFFTDGKASGGLDHYTDIQTWYDAAFYLMHNTWRDSADEAGNAGSDGYGKLAPQYHSMHLVAKTKADGSVYYVFNSAYDGAVYDPQNGEIYNSQTNTITPAIRDSGAVGDSDGNEIPKYRFDPLGPGNKSKTWLGYGKGSSGDTYGDMIAPSTDDWAEYYDTTNYHLSLEGHAEFVYRYSSNLYFTFTGDDDVYLYINGVRVLDIGGGHSVAKVGININDVAEDCQLQEGGTYKFDFFYMERHGTAANFGIETNIQLAESGMITTKNGYQNGTTTGYDAPINPESPVSYSFTLTNTGDATLTNLIFEDAKLDVRLGHDGVSWGTKIEGVDANGNRVGNGPIEKMYVYISKDGKTVQSWSAASEEPLTEDKLKEILKAGIKQGESITIYNLRYLITEEEWQAGNNTFTNIVNTTATDANNRKELHGTADWKVKKPEKSVAPFHIYNWVDIPQGEDSWQAKDENLAKADLTKPAIDAGITVPDNAEIVFCNASGNENDALWSDAYKDVYDKVTYTDGSLTFTSTKPGMETVYYKVKGTAYPELVYHFDVITYGVADNVYVLDYGLNVELNCDQYGFRVNDHLSVPQNIYEAEMTKTMDVRPNGVLQWGEFSVNGTDNPIDTSVEYRPTAIINGCDSMIVDIKLRESGDHEGKALKFYGVDMQQNVSTAPANVVYYEENFPGITYVSEGENQWIHYETIGEIVNENGETVEGSTAGTNQSPDQDSNYGSDPNYEQDKVGTLQPDVETESTISLNLDTSDLNAVQKLGIAALNAQLGLGGTDSNGTVNKLEVKQTADVMSFEFKGTGFEIISRTTAGDFAIINVQVKQDTDGDGDYETLMGYKPVITESKGGDLYQIPIISITGMERGNYKVTVKAAGSTDSVNRVLYIDGIRIYGPLESIDALEYYNPDESRAEFYEVKQLIQDGKAIYADASTTKGTHLTTGTTLVEDQDAEGVLTSSVGDSYEYLNVGPNNELYLDATSTMGMIAFYLTPRADYIDAARTLEIGAHRKTDSLWEDSTPVHLVYGDTAEAILAGTNKYVVGSGTEMYYTIDLTKLTPDANGRYTVMIGTNGHPEENCVSSLALTNIKIAGYDISFAETSIVEADKNGNVEGETIVAQTFAVLRSYLTALEEEPEVEDVLVNENLTINSASLRASLIVSGKSTVLTVKAGSEAQTIVITDGDGNVVTLDKCVRKVSNGVATFNIMWTVTGDLGEVQEYTIRAYDINDLASVNVETVTVTIK